MLGFLDERVEIELRGSTHNGPETAQKRLVAGEGKMFPGMLAEPGAADLKDRPAGLPGNRPRRAPEVGVVMRHPTPRAVQPGRYVRTVHAEFASQFDERRMALGKVGRLDGPIIDLGITIERPIRRPGWKERIVPNALEIGRLCARPRR